jgi:Trk K+ transport system NAD-binding subunit
MRVVVIGKGTIGSAISKALEEKGHEVVPVSRNSGKFRADELRGRTGQLPVSRGENSP